MKRFRLGTLGRCCSETKVRHCQKTRARSELLRFNNTSAPRPTRRPPQSPPFRLPSFSSSQVLLSANFNHSDYHSLSPLSWMRPLMKRQNGRHRPSFLSLVVVLLLSSTYVLFNLSTPPPPQDLNSCFTSAIMVFSVLILILSLTPPHTRRVEVRFSRLVQPEQLREAIRLMSLLAKDN